MTPPIVLASGSARRRELLARLVPEFEVIPPRGVDESGARGAAATRCQELAIRKAEAVLAASGAVLARTLVIGADTLIALGEGGAERIIGKPGGDAEAREILAALSGRQHRVVTAVAVARSGGATRVAVEESRVRFRSLEPGEIEAYVASGDARGKAGAYGIQSGGRELVAGFEGCYYNIVGLPLGRLAALLAPDIAVEAGCDCARHPLWLGDHGCGGGAGGWGSRGARDV